MRPLRKRRRIQMVAASVLLLGLASVLFGYAFRDGIQFFRTPSDVAAQPPPASETFRLGGMVEIGSLVRQGTEVAFRMSDGTHSVAVAYSGITPDLFAEGEGVIATGNLVDGQFQAQEILAKHDEEYMPRELADMKME